MRLYLVNSTGRVLAELDVKSADGDLYVGNIISNSFDDSMRKLFQAYSDIVNNQMLSYMDEIEERIRTYKFGVSVKIPLEYTPIYDLQIFNDNNISFRVGSPIK